MKAVQFTIDDELLRRIDNHPATKKRGRSAFLRAAASDYLRRQRAKDIREAYRQGYAKSPPTDDEFFVAPEAQAWPDE
ncbi:MAG TPA: ribbon-helix-helix protein, CopG family [Polyangia bacterium]|jgi:metal-responsive CopG/Arc/MetJ family transcriptional regulator|nr:ribbon-helix-helix protein, CopG family [Polyangia bacterium]